METIERIKRIYEEAGINGSQRLSEADTCERIITRLLREVAGYEYTDYYSQQTDAARSRPDYTILPGTTDTWYLEAKAWGFSLSDREAVQVLNSVNTGGKCWAVLTNGREWRLYDNHKVGVPASEKIQMQAIYPDYESLDRFLVAISKQSISSGKFGEFVLREKIAQQLEVGLADPDSALVKALARELNADTPDERRVIADFFKRKNSSNSTAETPLMGRTAPKSFPLGREKFDDDSLVSFSQIILNPDFFTGSRPYGLQLDQETEIGVSTWRDVILIILIWVDKKGLFPPLPFPSPSRFFLNEKPLNQHGNKMLEVKKISLRDGRVVYLSTCTDTVAKINQIESLCKATGIATDGIQVRLRFPNNQAP